ncbi:hypothetical protein HN588_02325 [Candidatus Bathyarchaeota archaeon]|nr:hypothetical protein [Candidatus Bathyarchaeota archaeon]
MHVAVTEVAVRGMLRNLLESGPEEGAPSLEMEKDETVPDPVVVVEPPVEELPVDPNPEIGTEGVFELPPIEDPEYVPGTQGELAKAAFAVGKSIPSQNVEQFWKELDRLAGQAETWKEDETMKTQKAEHILRSRIRTMLREAANDPMSGFYNDDDDSQEDFKFSDEELADARADASAAAAAGAKKSWSDIQTSKPKRPKGKTTTAWDLASAGKLGKPDEVRSADLDLPVGERGREGSWEEIAADQGFKSPSGAKQFVDDPGRLMDRTKFLMTMYQNEPQKFQAMLSSATAAYAEALLDAGSIEPDDAEYIKNNPEHTQTLESFRVFLKKYVMKIMRKDPDIQQHIKGRKDSRAADRAARKKKKLGAMI